MFKAITGAGNPIRSEVVVIRLIGKRCHPMHTLAYFAFNGLVGSPPAALLFGEKWTIPSIGWLGGMLLVGILGFTGQVCSFPACDVVRG